MAFKMLITTVILMTEILTAAEGRTYRLSDEMVAISRHRLQTYDSQTTLCKPVTPPCIKCTTPKLVTHHVCSDPIVTFKYRCPPKQRKCTTESPCKPRTTCIQRTTTTTTPPCRTVPECTTAPCKPCKPRPRCTCGLIKFDKDDLASDGGRPTKVSGPTRWRRFASTPRPTRSAKAVSASFVESPVVEKSRRKEPAVDGNSPPTRSRRPVIVTRVQDQTTDGGSLTVPCRSFTPRTAVRPRTPPTPAPAPAVDSVATETIADRLSHDPTRPHAVTLPTCWRLVDTAADPATKWFLKMTTTERWVPRDCN